MSHPSPFRNNRYEQEEDRRHVYFLLPDDLGQLEQLKSSYIVGTRGTGKTTLLKSLSWKERLESRSLQHALEGVSVGFEGAKTFTAVSRANPGLPVARSVDPAKMVVRSSLGVGMQAGITGSRR